jgi:manganese/zinc/iron transport system ATP- binding protein
MPTELLKARDLTVGYGSLPVLHEINFTIERGDFLGVMGPNGSGKTTLLKTFLGLLKPLSGTIESVGTEGGHLLFGYVPQRESLDFHYPLTALEVALMGRFGRIGVFRHPGEEDIRIARACLKQTHMDPFENRPYRALSGGQKQRVLISRALAAEPEILLLDEPTNGMDMNSERAIMELLTELQKEKQATIVFVTHLLSTIEKYAHRVAIITSDGQLLVGEKSKLMTPEVLTKAYLVR